MVAGLLLYLKVISAGCDPHKVELGQCRMTPVSGGGGRKKDVSDLATGHTSCHCAGNNEGFLYGNRCYVNQGQL